MRNPCPVLVALLLVFSLASPAAALTLDTGTPIGSVFELFFDGNVERSDIPALSATLDVELISFDGSAALLEMTLHNTSAVGSRVTVLAFDAGPDLASGGATGGFGDFITDSSLPNGVGAVEYCVKNAPNPNNCLSGAGGARQGEVLVFTVSLVLPAGFDSLELHDFHVRYQSIVGVSEGDSGTGDGTELPEPGAGLLLAVAAAATVVRRSAR